MACEDQISTEDLKNAKLDAITQAEIATSRLGGVAAGALIFTSTDRFGNTHLTAEGALSRIESNPINGGVWAVGQTFNAYNDYMVFSGVAYKPIQTTALPYVSEASPNLSNVEPFLIDLNPRKDFSDYDDLRSADSSDLADGDSINVTDDGIAGQFVVKTGIVTDNGGTRIVFSDDSNRYAERRYDGAIYVKWFESLGDDDTAGIQASINFVREEFYNNNNPHVSLSFGLGTFSISDNLLLPFGFDATGRPGIEGRIEIRADGAKIVGSGSASNDHDCFVSAYWDGSQNVSSVGTAGESHLAYGVTVSGFVIRSCRRAFNIQNWNQGCFVRDIFAINCQSAVVEARSFYCGFSNIVSQGGADESGCYITLTGSSGTFAYGDIITGATSGVTAVVVRKDDGDVYCKTFSRFSFSAGETINSSGGGSGRFLVPRNNRKLHLHFLQ